MKTLWEHRYAQRTQRMSNSVIRELLKFTEHPDMISFAGGLPAPEVFPVKEFMAACNRVLLESGPQSLQYSTTEGYLPLREMIVENAEMQGMRITPDNVLITTGSQQALDLIGKVFINPGDRVAVENPTYLGALQAWNAYGSEYVVVPIDDNGMMIENLEETLRTGPKFIYVLPNFQNPTGVSLSFERRMRLIELADHYGIPIVEDDPYGQLRYEGEFQPSIISMDYQYRENNNPPYTGNVIYLSTFSKILAPGLRLAWVIAPQEVIRRLIQAKQGADLHTATFNQMVAYDVSKDGFLDQQIKVIRQVYGEHRRIMLDALEEYFPPSVKWTRPEGGLFLWITLPNGLNSTQILQEAIRKRDRP